MMFRYDDIHNYENIEFLIKMLIFIWSLTPVWVLNLEFRKNK